MTCEVSWEARGVYKKFSGIVSEQEFVASTQSIHEDERFDRVHYVINDFLGIEGNSVPDSSIDYLAALWLGAQHSNSHLHVAFLTRDESIRSQIRYYGEREILPFPLGIFSDAAAARAWLATEPVSHHLPPAGAD